MSVDDVVLLLGAGRGQRMGMPKALMRVGGRPWWQIQEERLEATGRPGVWVLSDRVLASMGPVRPSGTIVRARDAAPMFESVVRGLEAIGRARGVFVQPIDVPLASGGVLDRLAASGEVAMPAHGGRHGHPLYLRWSFVEVRVLGSGGDRLDAITRDVRTMVEVDDPLVVLNLNRPEDLRGLEDYLR